MNENIKPRISMEINELTNFRNQQLEDRLNIHSLKTYRKKEYELMRRGNDEAIISFKY